MHQGKLLALDLLVRVLTNPMHDWSHMRPEFAGERAAPLDSARRAQATAPDRGQPVASWILLADLRFIMHSLSKASMPMHVVQTTRVAWPGLLALPLKM